MRAKKKPVIIDFHEYDGYKNPVRDWVESLGDNFDEHFINEPMGTLKVKTLEGTSYDVDAQRDVIIRGVDGEYYPCKKDIFEKTYDIVL